MIRPELAAALHRWREPLIAACVVLAGLWVATRGGWLLGPIGLILAALGAGLGLSAFRRVRFARKVGAPGIVELDEGQVAYMGPASGGFLSLRELAEIRLIAVQGQRHWRLKQADGQALIIPVDAAGADALYDAFAALPGVDMGRFLAAMEADALPQDLAPPLWRSMTPLART